MPLTVCVAYPHGDLDRGLTLQEDGDTAEEGWAPQAPLPSSTPSRQAPQVILGSPVCF